MTARLATPKRGTVRGTARRRKAVASSRAATRRSGSIGTAASAPRRAAGSERSRRLSSSMASRHRAAFAASVREALARRKASPVVRQRLLEPAKVKDPPARGERETASRFPGSPGEDGAPEGARAPAPAGARHPNEDLIREALRNRGQPYVWGGASRGGFDCSGFICYLFRKQRGMILPHSASAQARLGVPVRFEELQPGDLVFFRTYRPGISHVGIYIGNNRFIHAANRRKDVRIDSLTGYYARRLRAARRITPVPLKVSPDDLREYLEDASETPPAPPKER